MTAVEAYYFGCLFLPGHNYWTPNLRPTIKVSPWGWAIDSPEFDTPEWTIRHKDGWTALGIRDRTIDTRPGSISVFVFHSELTLAEATELAIQEFPTVWARLHRQ